MNTYSLIFGIALFVLFLTIISYYYSTNSLVWAEGAHIVSTRNHFNQLGNAIPNKPSYEPFPFDFGRIGCSQETVVYVHGVWTAKNREDEVNKKMFENAPEIFDRLRLSLDSVGYKFPVIGFSWDSDTKISSDGWYYAKIIAKKNGPKLAQFILDLQDNCPQTKIRLIAHSLGARMVLSSLKSLDNNEIWKINNFKIASVDLMGAAVDDDEVSKNSADVSSSDGIKSAYGKVIEKQVTRFYNLFDSEDDALEPGVIGFYPSPCPFLYYSCINIIEKQPVYYPYFEQGLALGQNGLSTYVFVNNIPRNYVDIPVKLQIPITIDADADADGECDLTYQSFVFPFEDVCPINEIGDNHLGYVGFRNPANYNNIKNNGAIDIVVDSFRNPP